MAKKYECNNPTYLNYFRGLSGRFRLPTQYKIDVARFKLVYIGRSHAGCLDGGILAIDIILLLILSSLLRRGILPCLTKSPSTDDHDIVEVFLIPLYN